MYIKIKFHLKNNVTQKKCQLKWKVTYNKISLKMECHLKWNFIQSYLSLNTETETESHL